MDFRARAKPCPAGVAVDLENGEIAVYRGSGIALLVVADGVVVEMLYGRDVADGAVLTAWFAARPGREFWLGYASATQIVNPRRIDARHAPDLAHAARRMFDPAGHF